MNMIDRLEAMLVKGPDAAVLRLGLGKAYAAEHRYHDALVHLRQATVLDPDYTAAWQALAGALLETDSPDEACNALENGIHAARRHGDLQAEKTMQVFLKRLKKKEKD